MAAKFEFDVVRTETVCGETTYAVKIGPEETQEIQQWATFSEKSFGVVLCECIVRGYDNIRDEPQEYGFAAREETTWEEWQLGQA